MNLRKIRLKNNLTQKQLSEKINVDRTTISKWESGENNPRMNMILKLAKILNCNISELFDEIS